MSNTIEADMTYDATSLEVLEGLSAIRLRPGMYVGSSGPEGVAHLLWELIDNAVDEVSAGHGKTIQIVLAADGSMEVSDEGRGIPVGEVPGMEGRNAVDVLFTELHSGGKFNGGGAYRASAGLHGIGLAAVNALSERVDVQVVRDGMSHCLSFHKGEPGHYNRQNVFQPSRELKTRTAGTKPTGTSIKFKPDSEVMNCPDGVPLEAVSSRAEDACHLIDNLRIKIVDERSGTVVKHGPEPEGLGSWVKKTANKAGWAQIVGPITLSAGSIGDGNLKVEIGAIWTDGEETIIKSWVNTVPTPAGGEHQEGTETGIGSAVLAEVKQANLRKLAKSETGVRRSDCLEGVVLGVHVSMPDPEFSGQVKGKLGSTGIKSDIQEMVKTCMVEWIDKASKTIRRSLAERVADATLEREAAARAAKNRRKVRKLSSSPLPSKLADCRARPGKGSASPELLIVEGDSAAGPAKRARNSEWQAVLPLRGKIVNAAKASRAQVLGNAEAAALFAAVGGGVGKSFDMEDIRYDRLIFLTDADVDGSHIRCLLITLVWRYMRPMFTENRVFAASPPTHAVQVGGKESIYVHSEAELKKAVKKAGANALITRFKGLGEMNDDELATCALDPATRILRPITIEDITEAEEAVTAAMGNDVMTRRNYISSHAAEFGSAVLDI